MKEILHQLIGSLSHYLQGIIHSRWVFGISSIDRITVAPQIRVQRGDDMVKLQNK